MFPLPIAMTVPGELVFKVEWYVSLTGCNEGPQGAGIQGEMVWYMFPLPDAMEVPGELVFKVEWYGMFPLLAAMKVSKGAGIQGGMVWYVSFTGCSEGPPGAGIQGGMVWYVSLTGCSEGPPGSWYSRRNGMVFPLLVAVKVPGELVFKVK